MFVPALAATDTALPAPSKSPTSIAPYVGILLFVATSLTLAPPR